MTLLITLPLLALLITCCTVSVRRWDIRCAAAREQFIEIHSRTVEGLRLIHR